MASSIVVLACPYPVFSDYPKSRRQIQFRTARRTVTAYGRISTGALRYNDVTYPYRKIGLETSIRYGTGSDTAENGCTGRTTQWVK
jgi:hypothetical protein